MMLLALIAQIDAGQIIEAVRPEVDQRTGSQILGLLLSNTSIGIAATVVLSVVGYFAAKWKLSEIRKNQIAEGFKIGFRIAEQYAAKDGKVDSALDKVTYALGSVDEWMVKNGWRKLDDGEKDIGKMVFTSMAGELKAMAKAANP